MCAFEKKLFKLTTREEKSSPENFNANSFLFSSNFKNLTHASQHLLLQTSRGFILNRQTFTFSPLVPCHWYSTHCQTAWLSCSIRRRGKFRTQIIIIALQDERALQHYRKMAVLKCSAVQYFSFRIVRRKKSYYTKFIIGKSRFGSFFKMQLLVERLCAVFSFTIHYS